jgi:hypothetical protein
VELGSPFEVDILEVSCYISFLVVNISKATCDSIFAAAVYSLHLEYCGQVGSTPSCLEV